MKVDGQNSKKLALMLVLLASALYLLVRNFSEDTTAAAPAITTHAGTAAGPARGARPLPLNTEDPSLRLDLLRASEPTQYTGTARNQAPEPAHDTHSATDGRQPRWPAPRPPSRSPLGLAAPTRPGRRREAA